MASQRNFKYYYDLQSAEDLLEKNTQPLEVKARALSPTLTPRSAAKRCSAGQGMADSFCKGPDRKYCRHWGPHGLCCYVSVQPETVGK